MRATELGPRGTDANRVWFAHMLRGVACLVVVAHHLGYAFWAANGVAGVVAHVDPLAVVPRAATHKYFVALERHHLSGGPFGVALFFLISGFVIPFSLERLDWKRFLVQRVFRLLPSYAAGLALAWLAVVWYALAHGRAAPVGLRDYLVNLSLLRDWTLVQSLDGVNWTLEMEARFYVVCAVLAAAATLRQAAGLWFSALALSFLAVHFPSNHRGAIAVSITSIYVPYMLIGTCFYNHFRGRWSAVKLAVVAGGLYAAFRLNLGQLMPGHGAARALAANYKVALGVFAACYLLRDRIPRLRVFDAAAAVSYPLYLVHGVAGYVLLTVLCEHGWGAHAALAVTLPAAFTVAWLLHRLVELPSQRMGKIASASRLAATLFGPPPAVAEAPARPPVPQSRAA